MNESDTTRTNGNTDSKKLYSDNLRQVCPKCNLGVDSYKNYQMTGRGGTTTRVYLFKCPKCRKGWRKGELESVEVVSVTENCASRPLTKAKKAKSLRKQVSLQQFEEMQKGGMTPREIATLLCQHYERDEDKAVCQACRKGIVRMAKELKELKIKNESYAPIDDFNKIPEIQKLKTMLKRCSQNVQRDIEKKIFRMWRWIRESGRNELVRSQRPQLWGNEHIDFILAKLADLKISTYGDIQALRRLFESLDKDKFLKDRRLRASAKTMRSPNNAQRRICDRFMPEQVPNILDFAYGFANNEDDPFTIKLHITLKCRIKALLGLDWSNVRWADTYYGFPMTTVDVYEWKGKVWWRHCPVDLWSMSLSKDLRDRWEKLGCPSSGEIIPFDYKHYQELWRHISRKIGVKLEPYDCRRSPSGWLRDLYLSDLAIGQYDAKTGEGTGFTGSGWENPTIYYTRYGKMNPLAIYDRSKRLNISMFDGLIHKILKNHPAAHQ